MNEPEFNVYRDQTRRWRWRLVASNGRIVADSGQSYGRRNECVEAVNRTRRIANNAAIYYTASELLPR